MHAGRGGTNAAARTYAMVKFTHNPLKVCRLRTAGLASVSSATFGMVRKNAKGLPRAHQGIDLIAAPGTRVYAVDDGEIIGINRALDGYGFTITQEILIEGVVRYAFYAHLSTFKINVGDKVKRGQVIALTGSSGNAAGMDSIARGSHLHFEIRMQQHPGPGLTGRLDPLKFVELDK
jgi:murein DD-endopeptidase MepM/ murein hydrolase activator NlpD